MTENSQEQGSAAPELYPFWGYSDLLLFAGLSILCVFLGVGAVKATTVLLHIHIPVRGVELVLSQIAAYALMLAALKTLLRVQYDRPFWRSLAWVEPRFPYLGVVALGVAAAIVIAVLAVLIKTPPDTPMRELMKDRGTAITLGVFGVTIGPLVEELTFRGFLQPLMVRSWGSVFGIIGTAVPFGVLHLLQYGKYWQYQLLISSTGVMFGWMRHVTGSTRASTVMQASYNGVLYAALQDKGRATAGGGL